MLPSLSQWLWLMMLLVLLAQPWRTVMVAADGDACFHWRVGATMLQTRQILRADIFSHSRAGAPIVPKEWLSEILFAVGGRLGGLYGVCVVGALALATTLWLLHRQLLREGNDVLVATLIALFAAWASRTHWLARPHVFSLLLVVLWYGALRQFKRDARGIRLAVVLGVLTLLWVNLHGGWLAGFVVLGMYWLGALVAFASHRDDSARHEFGVLTAVGLLCAAISLINPSGYSLHAHVLAFLRSGFLTNWLDEYTSTNFQSPNSYGFLAWLALIILTLAVLRPRLAVAEALVVLSWTYFALYSARNIPLLALLTAPIIAPVISEAARRWPFGAWQRFLQRMREMHKAGRGWPVVIAVAVVAIVAVPRPTEMPPEHWPVEAVQFIRAHPDKFTGKMFNQYEWGGYLMRYLPEHKVFVDPRTDFYGETFIREFSDTTMLRPGWTNTLAKYDIAWTLMPADHRMNQVLALLPGWERAYSDNVTTIFHHKP